MWNECEMTSQATVRQPVPAVKFDMNIIGRRVMLHMHDQRSSITLHRQISNFLMIDRTAREPGN